MPVRAKQVENRYGYGATGFVAQTSNSSILVDLKDEAPLINALSPNSLTPGDEPSFRWYYVTSVFKVTILTFNNDRLQRYNVITGKSKFGTVICRHNGYVTDEVLVSYADFMSAPYGTQFLFEGDESRNERIPCDEPPVEDPFPLLTNPYIIPASGLGDNLSQAPQNVFSTTRAKMAEEYQFYPEPPVQTYSFGVGYRYVTTIIKQAEAQLFGTPILINQ